VRLLPSLFVLQLAGAAVCAAQSPSASPAVPPPPVAGVEIPVGFLHDIAQDVDQRHDVLYCYFGSRVVTPAVRVHVDSIATVSTIDECNGVGLGFIMRTADRLLLQQMLRGVVEANPRFGVVSGFYATEDIDRWGDKVHVARSISILRGVSTTLTSALSSQ
jgi:hypothetical protein